MERIENRMASDRLWENLERDVPEEVRKKLNSEGRRNLITGIFVPEEDAYGYALEMVHQNEELRKEFVEWFYSNGEWKKED